MTHGCKKEGAKGSSYTPWHSVLIESMHLPRTNQYCTIHYTFAKGPLTLKNKGMAVTNSYYKVLSKRIFSNFTKTRGSVICEFSMSAITQPGKEVVHSSARTYQYIACWKFRWCRRRNEENRTFGSSVVARCKRMANYK